MNNKALNPSQSLIANRKIRKTFHNNEWWFAVEDVVKGFMSGDVQESIRKIKERDPSLKTEWGRVTAPFLIPDESQLLDCVTLEGAFRLIQAMPSPKAEPVRRWLAKVAFERLQEAQQKPAPKTDIKDVFEMLEEISGPEIARKARKALEKRLKNSKVRSIPLHSTK